MSRSLRTTLAGVAIASVAALALAGCSTSDPLESDADAPTSAVINLGSQAFPENETVAYIYGLALEDAGYEVNYDNLNLGSREVYIPALQDGSVDLLPEYSGSLLKYFDGESTAITSDEVFAELPAAIAADGLEVLDQSSAQNTDSLNVTAEYAEAKGLATIADLASIEGTLTIAANPEFADRNLGALAEIYGVDNLEILPIGDYGGPATLAALLDGTAQVADIYSTDAAIPNNDLVTLTDPDGVFPAQNVLPLIVGDAIDDDARAILNAISAELTTEDLLALNVRVSGEEKASSQTAAEDWLTDKGLIG